MSDYGRRATVVLSRDVPDDRDLDYRNWHQNIVHIASDNGGLLEANLYEPITGVQKEWIQVFIFETEENLRKFIENTDYQQLLKDSEKEFGTAASQQVMINRKESSVPVTVVVSQKVKAQHARDYQKWQLEIDKVARTYPGFMGTEMIKPIKGIQKEWVVVFRFDSPEHLENWFSSDDHKRLIKKAEPFFDKVNYKRIGRGFEDWFNHTYGEQAAETSPPQWKMAMIILLVLYPLVMIISDWILPFIKALPFAHQMFVSNVISVAVLTWFVMPAITWAFEFWLRVTPPVSRRTTWLGTILILVLYVLSVIVFSIIPTPW
ncbi:antibiotic biosynthesis monooxygenase [Roseibium sp. RKSG952]|uniref:antibiotic biosynthesis monooxygenase n=1 Tax=Roseibium sp. RKSG952 TaxID=2529384 RepID=UPI0012BC1D89|nr:antibiotic biosynthesis monooxygenase [Roseibium sp. RKSG952]MTH98298.1 hypothetical protein [Roseibium sp. RKSG952]